MVAHILTILRELEYSDRENNRIIIIIILSLSYTYMYIYMLMLRTF
ncbi:hypothetical protein H1O00_gp62 [Klebsiella phage vB_KpnS_IMGroot]|uniref:Uncharacterized protein n=1 Tax=Klebsiella phage vB_KpnS_IMGroot TaxID=2591375 RepID=A0A5B9NM88_9CAUD|nr:hypothetical protein H1O00_gp62 [Klebsiella phage vB_KpnS_IMGroot]QEG12043.1 hypothetical protein GROOT_62 [Klebsiella phage vB_KpnS_IMGroot]QPX75321.1 hypothetical protein [Klebsiella phage vB_KpnS_IMGroot]